MSLSTGVRSRSQHHVSWAPMVTSPSPGHGGLQGLMGDGDTLSESSKLHRLAKSDNCLLGARTFLDGKDDLNVKRMVESKNLTGSTPLHVAAYYGSREMINLLMDNGAKPLNKNKYGWHACHYGSRWTQPLDMRLSVGLKPCSPTVNSARFTFRKIRSSVSIGSQ